MFIANKYCEVRPKSIQKGIDWAWKWYQSFNKGSLVPSEWLEYHNQFKKEHDYPCFKK
ncbi:hypothetical protein Javan532_0030 [Streptococcus phage Javan532]|nr:putative phage protein [Streptococcus pyogenes]ESU90582.1 hypothetical protein HMPREF1243_0551 [Streptococcus pyogenes GA03747]QBX19254.1 hypothetical protein Javan477_0028 [Streptococcus phage Javan477]QBX20442.1 hypothetical protein Javan521_0030 [Streptococcus phage Javan521]QBX30364.1 hypothetical protein Javan532_0030 [Streptococcus phage Javan532]